MTLTEAIYSALPALSVSARFGVPLSFVIEERAAARRASDKRRKARVREIAMAERRQEAPYSHDHAETLRREADKAALDKFARIKIRFENDPRSKPFNWSKATVNSQRYRNAQPSKSGGGVSDIYETRGFDFHAGSKAA